MLRLALLVLCLFAPFSIVSGGSLDLKAQAASAGDAGGGLDPNGLKAQAPSTGDIGGGLDPDGSKVQAPSTGDISGGWDPNG